MRFTLKPKGIGIDLGSSHIVAYLEEEGIVADMPSVIALDKRKNKIVATGEKAQAMIGRKPEHIEMIFPIKNGVIADFDYALVLLTEIINDIKAKYNLKLSKPNLLLTVPSQLTQVQQEAVIKLSKHLGIREAFTIELSYAAAVGANLPVNEGRGNLIMTTGAGITEVAVIAWDGIVSSMTSDIAGQAIDKVIAQYIRQQYGLILSPKMQRKAKYEVGIHLNNTDETILLEGLDALSTKPIKKEVTYQAISDAIKNALEEVVQMIKQILENTSPELVMDISQRGLVLSGGGAKLSGVDDYLAQQLALPVYIAEACEYNVIIGVGQMLSTLE